MRKFDRPSLLEEMKVWLETGRSFLYEERIAEIGDLLKRGPVLSEEEKGLIGLRLFLASDYLGAEGLYRIFRGDTSGWSGLKRCLHWHYWSIRIRTKRWELNTRRTKQHRVLLNNVALCLSLAMALRDEEVTSWLGVRMRRSMEDRAFGKWELAQLPAFMLGLFDISLAKERSVEVSSVSEEPEPYSAVFETWDDKSRLASAILGMCDYHVDRNEDNSDEYLREFCRYPFSIFPAEVHALINVRQELALMTPVVDHALLEAPLNAIPKDIPLELDPIIEAAKAYG